MSCNCDGGPHLNKSATIIDQVGYDRLRSRLRLAIFFPTTADRLYAPTLQRSIAPSANSDVASSGLIVYYII